MTTNVVTNKTPKSKKHVIERQRRILGGGAGIEAEDFSPTLEMTGACRFSNKTGYFHVYICYIDEKYINNRAFLKYA